MRKIIIIGISILLIICFASCSVISNTNNKASETESKEINKEKNEETESRKNVESSEETQGYYIEAYPGANCIDILGFDGDVSVEYCCPLCGKEFSGFAFANLSDFGNGTTYIYSEDQCCTEHEYPEWFTWTVQFVKVPK